jgi:hypothetical protein
MASASSTRLFQELHSHVLAGNFQETAFLFTSPFSNVISPSQNASQTTSSARPGNGMCPQGACTLGVRSCFHVVFVREERNDFFFLLRIFCQPPAYFKEFNISNEFKDSVSNLEMWRMELLITIISNSVTKWLPGV